ncbi:globin [Paenibacillaceae bacterium]|nr:globin [Paenibacillaceae bacterium]
MTAHSHTTLYEIVGGGPGVRAIVEAFYPIVQEDPLISPLFPQDIRPVIESQYLFLTQFFGGPPLYSNEKGHPMMRARHMPFPIDKNKADAWLGCMRRALQQLQMDEELQELIITRLSGPAYHFINTENEEA